MHFQLEEKVEVEPAAPSGSSPTTKEPVVLTEFFEWCCRHFAQPVMRLPDSSDPESKAQLQQDFRHACATRVRKEAAKEQQRAGM